MKFKHYLTAIDQVAIYPLFSLLLFTIFFGAVTWYVFSTHKTVMEERAKIPIQ
ncbi:MAG: hypothetical protein RL596_640 [Bacteroidota bacterium]|jgi:cytochrome c oxidase cbb3-type subunit IV